MTLLTLSPGTDTRFLGQTRFCTLLGGMNRRLCARLGSTATSDQRSAQEPDQDRQPAHGDPCPLCRAPWELQTPFELGALESSIAFSQTTGLSRRRGVASIRRPCSSAFQAIPTRGRNSSSREVAWPFSTEFPPDLGVVDSVNDPNGDASIRSHIRVLKLITGMTLVDRARWVTRGRHYLASSTWGAPISRRYWGA